MNNKEDGNDQVFDEHKCEGRLTRVDDKLLCDCCYEETTGFIPTCQDYCSLHLDHDGECK